MIRQQQFFVTYVVRRASDLSGYKTLSDLSELPVGSVLHTIDNFDKVEPIIPPNIDNQLFKLQPDRKRIHIASLVSSPTDIFTPDMNSMRFVIQGVTTQILKFKQENARVIKLVEDVQDLPAIANMQSVINYNSLFNLRVTGRFQTPRIFNYIMNIVFNYVKKLEDRHHYIHIPFSQRSFSRSEFARLYKAIDNRFLTYPDSMQYLFMAHLLTFIDADSKASMFESVPANLLDKVNFVITCGDRFVIYNLGTLKSIAESSVIDIRILAHVNLMCTNEDPDNKTESAVVNPDKKIADKTLLNTSAETAKDLKRIVSEVKAGEKKIESTPETIKAIKQVVSVESDDKVKKAFDDLISGTSVTVDSELEALIEKANATLKLTPQKNSAEFTGTPSITKETAVKEQKTALTKRNEAILKRIDENEKLSAAQKRRAKTVALAYKDLELPKGDGTSIKLGEALLIPPIDTVDSNKLEFLKGQVKDESMLSSSIVNLDDQYMKHQFHSDLAKTIMSFRGMHPIEIKHERIDDPLNRLDVYTVKYEDENQKTHTSKFTLPTVDEHGLCLINGTYKAMTKQRLNTPITKVNDHRVSLSSNYNKTLIERHDAVAYSFVPYVEKLFEKGEYIVARRACYPFVASTFITFPEAELKALKKRYDSGKRIFTIRTDAEYEKWDTDLDNNHIASPIGDLLLLSKTKLTSIKAYAHYEELKASNPEAIKGLEKQNKLIVLELLPEPVPVTLPYYYTALARRYCYIQGHDLNLVFSYYSRFNEFLKTKSKDTNDLIDKIREHEDGYGTFIGTLQKDTYLCFMDIQDNVTVVPKNDLDGTKTVTKLIDILTESADLPATQLNEWLDFKILNKSVPVGFALCFRYGLINMLDYMHVKYEIYPSTGRLEDKLKSSDLVIKCSDKKIIIRNASCLIRLIFSGMNYYDLRSHLLEDLNKEDAYHTLIESRGLSINYLKGIESFFELFIDPMTADVLKQMGEPTDPRDLLIRCAVLLTTEDHSSPSSTSNTTIRTYNRFVAAVYNEMARAYSTWKYGAVGSTDKFSVNPQAVFQKILADQLMTNVDEINPVDEFKRVSGISHTGDGGRSADTFMVADRNYTQDNIGVVSEATVDSGKVAINATLSVNPNIKTLSGLAKGVDPSKVEPSQLLSITGVLFPGVTYDDSLSTHN